MRKYISLLLSLMCILIMTTAVFASETVPAPATSDTFTMVIGLLCVSAAVLLFFIITVIIIKSKKKK